MAKLFILVDYQNDFVNGSLGFEGADKIDLGIAFALEAASKNKDKIAVTQDTHDKGYMDTIEGKNLPVPHCIIGTEGHKIFGKTGEWVNDNMVKLTLIQKDTFPADNLLKYVEVTNRMHEAEFGRELDGIYLMGVVTNICVISNAVICKAAAPNVPIYIIRDLCGSNDKVMEQKAFDVMENLHMKVIESCKIQ